MFNRIVIPIACVFLVVPFSDVKAEIFERDWRHAGDGLLTFDDLNGREWLDLTETIDVWSTLTETTDMSLAEVSAQLETMGDYAGFSIASASDLVGLAKSAGINTDDCGNCPENFIPTRHLIGLVGPTDRGAWIQVWASGILVSDVSQELALGTLTRSGWDTFSPDLGEPRGWLHDISPDIIDNGPPPGIWLVRPVPEPTSFWLLFTGLIGIARCRRAASTKCAETRQPMSRRTSHSIRAILVLLISIIVSESVAMAQIPRGKVVTTTFDSPALEGNFPGDSATRRARVYLPPSYETSSLRYPVLYYLHGAGGNVNNFFTFSGHNTADRLIAEGSMQEMIIVAVDGGAGLIPGWHGWFNTELNGNYEDYVTQDLVSHIDSEYRTIPQRDSRGLFGQSMGGASTSIYAMKYSDVFGAAYSLASNFYSSSQPGDLPDLSGDQVIFTGAPNALNQLKQIEDPSDFVISAGGLLYASSLVFSPNVENAPLLVDYPFDLETLDVIPEIRDKWYAYDAFVLLEEHANDLESLRGYGFGVGLSDGNLRANNAFHQALLDKGIEHDYTTFPGGHAANMHIRYETPMTLFSQWLVHYGDFDKSGELDIADVNTLIAEIAAEMPDLQFDITDDQRVNRDDLTVWVKELRRTWIGDANLDGEFNSTDLVVVFQVGAYEQAVDIGWDGGDWTGDRRFGSEDLVAAFQDGGYELGSITAVSTVPEPSCAIPLGIGMIGLCRLRKRR